jgi:hypothetical protein
MKDNTLTIAFTTIGRYESLTNLLTSIKDTVKVPHSILIVNSGSDLDLDFKSKYTQDFEVINSDTLLRTPQARNIMFEKCESSYLLIMDDDMVLEENTVTDFIKVMETHPDIDILGCAVSEYGRWRDIGFRMFMAEKDNKKVVYKDPIYKKWLDDNRISLCKVDIITQPPWVFRKNIYKHVKFDENYPWASDIFDFFMECKNKNIVSMVTPNIKVKHEPKSYDSVNHKHNKIEGNKIGKKYFAKKWGMEHQKIPDYSLLVGLIKRYSIRRSRRIMIKNKIKIDGVKY